MAQGRRFLAGPVDSPNSSGCGLAPFVCRLRKPRQICGRRFCGLGDAVRSKTGPCEKQGGCQAQMNGLGHKCRRQGEATVLGVNTKPSVVSAGGFSPRGNLNESLKIEGWPRGAFGGVIEHHEVFTLS